MSVTFAALYSAPVPRSAGLLESGTWPDGESVKSVKVGLSDVEVVVLCTTRIPPRAQHQSEQKQKQKQKQ
ncbi:uncharacterized protein N7511_006295 [Penicillium nucicola]|uniref:uncharacterized protein n=1 Tax=Penicillium nucicola TaxID=1850975 RepID=UPI0025455BAD|nr:uncharacterized protein N7511_006295 [Penicillium nucicola]KAJ5757601.1 hypothetical protein N7511_006295 [Penicillium nucicola]